MTDKKCLDQKFSTTRLVTTEIIMFENCSDAAYKPAVASTDTQSKEEGGLRTQGYFKTSQTGKPLVTVVTVVFNGDEFLEETILSVINQDYDNVEYLIIDGGSSDMSLEIIRQYQHAIDYWVSEKDEGIYDAMNKGIDLAAGDWINFMNCGDSFYSNKVFSDIEFSSRSSCVLYGLTNLIYSKSLSKIVDPVSVDLKKDMPFVHQSSFVKASVMKSNQFNRNEFSLIADRNFFLTIANQDEVFEKLDLVVSNSDVFGISSVFSFKMEWEQIILGFRFNKIYMLIYMCKMPVRLLKHAIKQILPLSIANQIRSRVG